MQNEIRTLLEKLPGRVSCYYKNLVTGEHFAYHGDIRLQAASVIKTFIMAEAFRQIEAGKLKEDTKITIKKSDCVPPSGVLTFLHEGIEVTILDLITLMIVISDNTATNLLIDLLGMDAVNRTIQEYGFTNTELNRKMYDSEKSAQGIQNYITARETGEFLEKMYRGELVSKKASERMLAILKNQQVNHKIPFLIGNRNEELEIAHKTGEDTGITHDVGIVYAKEPFILCICGNETDVPALERAMAEIAFKCHAEKIKEVMTYEDYRN